MKRLLVAFLFLPLCVLASVTSTTTKSGPFLFTGSPQTIPIGFPAQQASDLLVLDTGPTASPHDPALVLTLGSDYTVTGLGYNGSNQMQTGSIVVVSTGANSVAVNDYIVILRNAPFNQTSVFSPSGPLTINLIEQALDKMATLSQQVNELGSRSLHFENFEFLNGNLSKTARTGNFLGFDSNGNLAYYPTGTVPGGFVSQIVAGTNVTITPSGGTGAVTINASGGTPGGSTTQLQYNNAGAFGGTSGLTWNGTNLSMATGNIAITSNGSFTQTGSANSVNNAFQTQNPNAGTSAGTAISLQSATSTFELAYMGDNATSGPPSFTGGPSSQAAYIYTGPGTTAPIVIGVGAAQVAQFTGTGTTLNGTLGTGGAAVANIGLAINNAFTYNGTAIGLYNGVTETAQANGNQITAFSVGPTFNKSTFTGLVYQGINLGAVTTSGTGIIATSSMLVIGSAPAGTTTYGIHQTGTDQNVFGGLITAASIQNTPIGSVTPNTVAATTLSASSTVSGTGFSTYLASPPAIGGTAPAAGAFTTLSATSTVGGAGFSTLFNSPPPIGQVAPNPGAFTTLSASNTVSGTGFSNYLASPPAIGGTAPNTVAATTLSASSTVSGTGFSTYLASPPAIGGTAPAAGAFTTLSASSTVSGTGFSTYLASPPAIGGTAPSTGAFTTLSATGAFTPAQVAGIVGTTTNNNAQAGSVGEYMQTLVVAASEVALTNNTSANMCSMSLTAGDWDISGLVMFDVGATTNFTEMYAWATTTSAQTLTLAVLNTATVAAHSYPVGGSVLSNIVALTLPPTRFSLSATTTVYLVAMSRFTVSTAAVFGGFRARRVR